MKLLNWIDIELYVNHEWEKTFWCKGEEKKETSWNMKKNLYKMVPFQLNLFLTI